MTKQTIVDITHIAQTFPQPSENEVPRENIWNTVETLFKGDCEVILVEGNEGIGKTTLLAQLAKKHCYNAFSLFIRPVSRFTYDLSNLRFDLCNQVAWLLQMKEIRTPSEADEGLWNSLAIQLHRHARRKNEIYYFIIDGLSQLPEDAVGVRTSLLAMLPIGMTQFRFIISGDETLLTEAQQKKLPHKSLPLSPFILEETHKFLAGLPIAKEEVESIHKTCSGVPGHLASIRRLIASGTPPGQIIDEVMERLPDLLHMEWQKCDRDNALQRTVLAILAHVKKRHTCPDLAIILGTEERTIVSALSKLPFIVLSQKKELDYVSESFRRFAAERLADDKRKVNEIFIKHMLALPQSKEALLHLPGYLHEAHRYEEILNYLSAETLDQLLACAHSLTPVREKIDLGLDTALHLHRDGEIFRFAMGKAALTSLYEGFDGKSEIQARIALSDYDAAVMLAQRATLKEDRLHLMAVLAKAKLSQGLEPEQEIREQIKQLYSEVDSTKLGSRALTIATDLIASEPQLAIEMVEAAAKASGGENVLDIAFAKLSLAVMFKPQGQDSSPTDLEKITEKIGNQEIKELVAALSKLTINSSAIEAIALAKTMKETSEALFVLRQWAIANKGREDAADVLQYSLEIAISATDYAPNATVWRELSTPLAFLTTTDRVKQLVGMIDAQKTTVERLGPSEDVVRLQLNLVRAEIHYDLNSASSRMVETYFYIEQIEDISIKATCLGWLVATLLAIDSANNIDRREGVLTIGKSALEDIIVRLLNETASHTDSLSGVITALAEAWPDKSLQVATSLNTQSRRDNALLQLFKALSESTKGLQNISLLETIIDKITAPPLVDEAIATLAEQWTTPENTKVLQEGEVIRMVMLSNRIHDSYHRCRAIAKGIVLLKQLKTSAFGEVAKSLEERLFNTWNSIDSAWIKCELGFDLANSLATVSLETARNYADKAENLTSQEVLGSVYAATTYIRTIDLAIRAFPGLLSRSLDEDVDWKSLEELIGWVPSHGGQAKLWADLAVRCYLAGKSEHCQKISTKYIRPLLSQVDKEDRRYWHHLNCRCAPALYFSHHRTALDEIVSFPPAIQDIVYHDILDIILFRKSTLDPCDPPPKWTTAPSYEEIADVLEILNLIERDTLIYSGIERLANGLTDKHSRDKYSEQQKAEIARKLDSLIDKNLPSQKFIQHEGFKLIAKAQVARIRNIRGTYWDELILAAEKIPNKTDVVYVLIVIACALPSKEAAKRKGLLDKCLNLIESLPSDVDKTDLLEHTAHQCWDIDSTTSKKALTLALKLPTQRHDEKSTEQKRRIIDLANKLDPELASSMASLLDNDPARPKPRKTAHEQLDFLNLRNRLIDPEEHIEDLSKAQCKDLPLATWRLLASLNADRISTVDTARVRLILNKGSNFSLKDAYPVLCWAIENNRIRFSDTEQASTLLAPIFHGAVECSRLTFRVATHRVERARILRGTTARPLQQESLIVAVGKRDEGKRFIHKWLSNEPVKYLKICDPYFGPDDLELLKVVLSLQPNIKVEILTSYKHQRQILGDQTYETVYRDSWHSIVSDQPPPDTDIIVVGTKSSGALPIHDRWWVTDRGGIRMGTSYNSLGTRQDSEISLLSQEESKTREAEIDKYILKQTREHNGEKLLFSSFTL